jgi:hypothetical protein
MLSTTPPTTTTTALDRDTGRLLDTYETKAEADADRAQQQELLSALGGWQRALQIDPCGAWVLAGTRGRVFAWGDGKTWLLHAETSSERADTYAHSRLAPLCQKEPGRRLRLMHPPTPEQAETIRDVLGIRKRRTISEAERERLKGISGLPR